MSVQSSSCASHLFTKSASEVTQAGMQASGRAEVGQDDPGALPSNPAVTDPAKTPRGEEPPMLSRRSDTRSITNETTPIARSDYFTGDLPPSVSRTETESTSSNVSSPLQSAGASSSSLHSTGPAAVAATAGFGHSGESKHASELRSKLFKVQSYNSVTPSTASGSTSNQSAAPSRPTTNYNRVPPQYPDQSFAALSRQRFTPPYPYRSNSPFASQSSHASASPNNLSSEHLHLPGISRTEGNTPVESPGLFQPGGALRRGRDADEMEPNQYRMPALHPTHGMMPKESHSLRKDVDHLTGHKLINNYEVLKELGTGTHGKVKLARVVGSPNNAKVAIKIVKRFRRKRLTLGGPQTQEDRVKKEIAVLKKARHHHVVSLLEVIDDPEADKVYMVLEYVEEGEMKWRRKADKWTVDFERHRIERERDAWNNNETIDADLFAQEVTDFNSQRETRAAEKRRDLARQKKLAYQMVSSPSRRSSVATILTDDESHARVLAAKWSLEHGGDSEDEASLDHDHGQEQAPALISRAASSLSLAQTSANMDYGSNRIDFQPLGGLEVSTVFKDPFVPESAPMSPLLGQGVSHPSGSQLSDTIENDTAFLAALKKIQRDEDAELFDREDKPYRHVPCLSMIRCRECFRDTVLGLEYLHYQGIIHRDIKPANLLWDRGRRVKISDFGVSYLGHSPRGIPDDEDGEPALHGDDEVELAKTVGTPAFYAPELCDPELFADGRDNRRQIGSAMDVWALGVTLYCMIFARLPFDDLDNNEMSLYHKIAKEDVFIPRMRPRAVRLRKTDGYEPKDRDEDALEYEAIGDELHDLLKRLLHKNPAQRITIQEIKRHPWVVHGMENLVEWLDKTDPANYISDKKIHVTNEDVSAAMQPMSLVGMLKQGVKRFSSMVRGRDSSRGGGSRSSDKNLRASSQVSTGLSAGTSNRRASLREPEQIANLIRAQRTDEHPLSQSQVPSPQDDGYFSGRPIPATHDTTPLARPGPLPRGGSTAESIMTVRATKSRGDMRWHFPSGSPMNDSLPLVAPSTVPYAGATNIYGKQFSQPPSHGLASQRSSLSSYSATSGTSSDNLSGSFDDTATHASPSIAMSSATATGRVAPPSVLQEASSASSSSHDRSRGHHSTSHSAHQQHKPQPRTTGRQRAVSAITSPRSGPGHFRRDSGNAMRRAEESNLRRQGQDWMMRGGTARGSRATSRDFAAEFPPSPDDAAWVYNQTGQSNVTARPCSSVFTAHHRGSRADVSGASSSDDFQAGATFSDNSRHPSMPSVISSVGSSSADTYDTFKQFAAVSNPKINDSLMSTGETVTPARTGFGGFMDTAKTGQEKQWQNYAFRKQAPRQELTTSTADDDEAGYIGDQDNNADMDSDDEGIVFGGKHV